MKLNVLDPVVLTEDLPTHGLRRGDMGAIVEIYSEDDVEVEFVTAAGITQALLALHINQLRPVGPHDIPAVRSLAACRT